MLRGPIRRLQATRFVREFALIGGAYMAYELVRSLAAGRALDAFENTEIVVRAEQALGIFVELNLQVAMLSYSGLIDFLSLWYFWGHFPLMVLLAVWALYRHNRHYVWGRNAIFAAGGLALIVYLLFPVAPPRLIPGGGFVDTLRGVFALQYEDSSLVNEFAAVPSMHQGFAIIMGMMVYRIVRGRLGLAALVLLPGMMLITIVATGNHWFLDAVLGAVAAIAGMGIANQIERHSGGLRKLFARRLPHRGGTGSASAQSPS
jgi:hypothetical protein